MEAHRRTFFTPRGIAVAAGAIRIPGQRPVPGSGAYREIDLFSGAMHYWRLDPDDWRACLVAMKDLGLHVVETYVPWGVHEIRPGNYDWEREYNLARFLDLVASLGMYAIVRPGPCINAELTYLGFPERLLKGGAGNVLAVSGRGTPAWLPLPPRMFPVPSYAAQPFRDEVATWFAAVAEIVAPRLAPGGPVIAVQVDNESQMFHRLGAYDLDYHPDALAWWDEYSAGDEPPRAWDPGHAERCVRWVRFKEEYAARALRWQKQALAGAGITGVALFHNAPDVDPTLVNLPGSAAAVGLAGMDFHLRGMDHEACRRRGLYLVGSAASLPYVPELGAGGPVWLPPVRAREQQNLILDLLACGVRAFNVYMAVERERWYGAPISELGEPGDGAPWLKKLIAALAAVQWTTLRRQVPVALVSSRADARFAIASSVVEPMSPVIAELLRPGPAGAQELALDHAAAARRRWMTATERALDLAQVPYAIVDEECPIELLSAYRVIIVPTVERVDRALWRKLHQLGKAGAVIVIGPGKPVWDEAGRPLDRDAALPPGAGLIRPESMDDLPGFAADLAAVAGDLPEDWLAEHQDVDCSLFEDPDGQPRALFLKNRGSEQVRASVLVVQGCSLADPMTGETWSADQDGCITVSLAGRQVRMLLVEIRPAGSRS